jgi:hypothetical protein
MDVAGDVVAGMKLSLLRGLPGGVTGDRLSDDLAKPARRDITALPRATRPLAALPRFVR